MQHINKGAGHRNLIAYFAIMAGYAGFCRFAFMPYFCRKLRIRCVEGRSTEKRKKLCAVMCGEHILVVQIKKGITRSQLVKVSACPTARVTCIIFIPPLLRFKYLFHPE